MAVPQSCGLGGGFFATIYSKSSGKVEMLNAREVAPLAATADMFVGETSVTGIKLIIFWLRVCIDELICSNLL